MEPGYITLHVKDAPGCWEPSYLVKTNIPVLWSEPGYIAFPLYVPVFLSYVPVFAATYIPVPSMEAGHIKFLSYVPVFKLYNPVFSTTGTYLPRPMIRFVVVRTMSTFDNFLSQSTFYFSYLLFSSSCASLGTSTMSGRLRASTTTWRSSFWSLLSCFWFL